MTEEQAKTHKHNPFDVIKVWPKADYPLIEVGVMELNRYPESYFAEVEQAAFSPANVVPGIGFSPDKMLQGSLFSYGDTQRYRLGVNFNHIPVNAPKCPFHSYHRDDQMRTDGNLGATTYNPNSQRLWDNQPEYAEPPLTLEGDASHYVLPEETPYPRAWHHTRQVAVALVQTPLRLGHAGSLKIAHSK